MAELRYLDLVLQEIEHGLGVSELLYDLPRGAVRRNTYGPNPTNQPENKPQKCNKGAHHCRSLIIFGDHGATSARTHLGRALWN